MKTHRKHPRSTKRNAARRNTLQRLPRLFEHLETRTLLAADVGAPSVWQNQHIAADVNNDGRVTPSDVLTIIDELNRNGVRQLDQSASLMVIRNSSSVQPQGQAQYLDVNGDSLFSPADLLLSIDAINRAVGDPDTATVTSQVFDLGGNPITEILQGTNFYVGLVVEDTRPDPAGVFSAYADVTVNDTSLVDFDVDPLVGSAALRFNPPSPFNTIPVLFNDGRLGTLQDNNPVIQGAGAFNSAGRPNVPAPVTVWTATMLASQSGLAEFTPSTSTGTFDDILVYDRQSPNDPTVVTFVPSSVNIVTDAPPVVSIVSNSALENAGTITFDVMLTAGADPITRDVYVVYSTSNGTAAAGADFVAQTSQTLTFLAGGATTAQVTVPLLDDNLFEGDETFNVNLLFASNALVSETDSVAVGTIIDNEIAPELVILDPAPVVEGDIGQDKTMTFTVELSSALTENVIVGYASQGISATSDVDFGSVAGQLTFLPGETVKTIDVTIFGDVLVEGEETFLVRITSVTPNTVTVKDDQAVGRIIDNDAPVGFSINDVQTLEGDSGFTDLVFTVSLNTPLLVQSTVQYATGAGGDTATSGVDYQPTNGILTFAPGVMSQQLTVRVVGDTDVEPDELFSVVLSDPVGTVILDSTGIGTILNDDGNNPIQMRFRLETRDAGDNVVNQVLVGDAFTLLVYVDDVTVADQGVFSAYLDVLYSAGLIDVNGPIEFDPVYNNFRTGDTSVDGLLDDMGAADGQDPLGPAEHKLLSVPMIATAGGVANFTGQPATQDPNTLQEIVLYGSGGAAVPLNQVDFGSLSLTIVESTVDTFIINNVSQLEGNEPNTTSFVFTVTRLNSSGNPATVEFATQNGTATVADNDYLPTNGTLSFSGVDTTQTITVTVVGDDKFEPNETFSVVLSNPNGAELGNPSTGTGTIQNDDEPIIAGISGLVYVDANNNGIQEGNEPGIAGVIITATNEAGTFEQYTVTDANGQFVFADLPQDKYFIAQTQPGFYLDGRETPENLRALDLGGNVINDTFFIDLAVNPNVQVRFAERGVKPEFLAAALNRRMFFSTTINGGLNGLNSPIVDANLRQGDIWVSFDDGWDGLRKFQAYFDPANGTAEISLWAFDRRGNLVKIASPTTVNGIPEIAFNGEAGKNYFLKITGTNTNASVKIIDTVRVVARQVAEANNGTTDYEIEVKLSGRQTGAVEVVYATANNTATSPQDFISVNGTFVFAPGERVKTFPVSVVGDLLDEVDETFLVNLSTTANFVEVAPGPFEITILDNDPLPRISLGSTSVVEGSGGTTNAVFVVTLSEVSGREVTVAYQTVDDVAKAGADYTAVSGTLTFAPGTLAQTISVPVLGDTFLEADEAFRVVLSSPIGTNILAGVGTGIILNDDNGPQFIPLGGGQTSGLNSFVEFSTSSTEATGVLASTDTSPVATSSTTTANLLDGTYRRPFSRSRTVESATDAAFADDEEDWLLVA